MQIDTNHYKEKLLAEKKRLEDLLNQSGRQINDTGDWVATQDPIDESDHDPTSIANRVEDFAENVASITNLEVMHNDVVDALQKIENGTYGACEVSGEPIEAERLEANPAARTCITHMGEKSA